MNQDVLMINYVDVQDAKVIEIVVLPIFTRWINGTFWFRTLTENDEPFRNGWFNANRVENGISSCRISSKRVEGNNFDARKRILEYDEVLRKQREIIYNERNEIIDSEESSQVVNAMLRSTLQRAINHFINEEDDNPDYTPFINYVNDVFLQEGDLQDTEIKGKDSEDIFEIVWSKIEKHMHSNKKH